jgi:hypothetical protein
MMKEQTLFPQHFHQSDWNSVHSWCCADGADGVDDEDETMAAYDASMHEDQSGP